LPVITSKTYLIYLRTLLQTLYHPSAILDLHFLANSSTFGVAASTGTISIYTFESSTKSISHITTHQAFDPALLVLSFTWYPTTLEPGPLLAATLSSGSLHLLQFTPNFNHLVILNDSEPLNTHPLEAWTCAFSLPSNSGSVRIYSGGDDGKLRLVELESLPTTSDSEIRIVQTIPQSVFKGHEAGVTAILPLPLADRAGELGDVLLTGSYDDHVRVYRPNAPNTTGKVLVELKIGGGVWRLKLLSTIPDAHGLRFRVLASCMHAGARILEVFKAGEEEEWKIEVLAIKNIHESMCYGSDVQPVENGADEEGGRVCVSTSFYDMLVCVWKFVPSTV
jgi:diphthamide biosynthesis protein 7